MRATIRDTELFFDVDGAGLVPDSNGWRERPVVFLVHGGPGPDHTAYKLRWPILSDQAQVVYFDHRGHGRSARGDEARYTLDQNVEDMEALRRYLGVGPVVSLGASYGGMVAMAHAARYPQAVSHLILVATASHAGFIRRARMLARQIGSEEQVGMLDELLQGRIDTTEKLERYLQVMAPLYMRRKMAGNAGTPTPAILEPAPMNRALGAGGFLHTLDLRPELGQISAPTLICAGRHDFFCAPEFSQEMHERIPGSQLRIFEDSGHVIGADEPQTFKDAVLGFLSGQSCGARPALGRKVSTRVGSRSAEQ